MAPQQTLRILCLGDSLTAGYSSYGAVFHPYEERLAEMLKMALPELTVETVEDGVPGAQVVTHHFLDRIETRFEERKERYDWTIILGGTNDLSFSASAEEIFDELCKIYNVALSNGSKVLALTVPEVGIQGGKERLAVVRNKLNKYIKEYKAKNYFAFDLHAVIPYFSMSEENRTKYWDDGVHFTPAGYDLIGQKVGIQLVSLVVKEREKTHPRTRRKIFKDDYQVFDEERGSPVVLDQGYVVVRRKDLD